MTTEENLRRANSRDGKSRRLIPRATTVAAGGTTGPSGTQLNRAAPGTAGCVSCHKVARLVSNVQICASSQFMYPASNYDAELLLFGWKTPHFAMAACTANAMVLLQILQDTFRSCFTSQHFHHQNPASIDVFTSLLQTLSQNHKPFLSDADLSNCLAFLHVLQDDRESDRKGRDTRDARDPKDGSQKRGRSPSSDNRQLKRQRPGDDRRGGEDASRRPENQAEKRGELVIYVRGVVNKLPVGCDSGET